jgi:hypothetical protein
MLIGPEKAEIILCVWTYEVLQQEAELRGWPCQLPLWNYCEPPACCSYPEFMAKYKVTSVIATGTTGSVRAGIQRNLIYGGQVLSELYNKNVFTTEGQEKVIYYTSIVLYMIHAHTVSFFTLLGHIMRFLGGISAGYRRKVCETTRIAIELWWNAIAAKLGFCSCQAQAQQQQKHQSQK